MLREFKAKYATKIIELKKKLIEKYPDKRDRIENIIDLIMVKLERLRRYDLADYLFTLYHATKEFPELQELVPSSDDIEALLSKENQTE